MVGFKALQWHKTASQVFTGFVLVALETKVVGSPYLKVGGRGQMTRIPATLYNTRDRILFNWNQV